MLLCGMAGAENMGLVPMSRVVRALFALQQSGLEGRLRITFELFDVDRSGSIDRQELFEILKVSLCRITTSCSLLDNMGWLKTRPSSEVYERNFKL